MKFTNFDVEKSQIRLVVNRPQNLTNAGFFLAHYIRGELALELSNI